MLQAVMLLAVGHWIIFGLVIGLLNWPGDYPINYQIQNHQITKFSRHAVTTDPTGSPAMARLMLPGRSRLKTTIGRRLSMQREIAVASITLRPCSSTCREESRSKREA